MSLIEKHALWPRRLLGGLICTLVLSLPLGMVRQAQALTFVLDFVGVARTDIFGTGTNPANFAPYGFGLTLAQIQQATLAAIRTDYLGYPTVGTNALSPLPNGKELNINFELGTVGNAPGNGDLEYYYMAIGDNTTGGSFLGQACFGCVRNGGGGGPFTANSGIVGSILTDNIATLAGLASTDAERINLLAGTVSHEIGHTLFLDHPNGQQPNPGASLFDLMASGAAPSNMPNDQRILDRAFSYDDFGILIAAVGTRDVSAVPEPAVLWLFGTGIVLLMGLRWRRVSSTPAAL